MCSSAVTVLPMKGLTYNKHLVECVVTRRCRWSSGVLFVMRQEFTSRQAGVVQV